MQRDRLLLTEMIDAAQQAQELARGVTVEDLRADRQRRDALLCRVCVSDRRGAPLGRQRYLQAREKPRNLISPVGQLYIAEYLMPGDVPARLQPGQHPAATWCASATRPSPAKRRTSSR